MRAWEKAVQGLGKSKAMRNVAEGEKEGKNFLPAEGGSVTWQKKQKEPEV